MSRAPFVLPVLVISVWSIAARADTTCQGQTCISQVDFQTFAEEAYDTQHQDEWCWAASISMIFKFYGHPVSQQEIVSSAYGSPVNMPARSGAVIGNQLDRTWRDDNGKVFCSKVTGAYDSTVGYATLRNSDLVSELDGDHPLVIGARTHAMVMTAIQYNQTPQGPYVTSVGVFDPWPGIGARGLALDEMTPDRGGGSLHFLASVRLTDGECPSFAPGGPETPVGPVADTGGGCTTSGASALALAALVGLRRRATRSPRLPPLGGPPAVRRAYRR